MNHIKKEIGKILSRKQTYLSYTLEGYASGLKNEYIICKTLYKKNKLVFNIKNKNNKSFIDFNNIVSEIEKHIITTEEYKKIARSSLWRNYWNANKSNNLFDNVVSRWTDEQRALVSISKMYDNIYEHPECPDDKVIEDDDMLDGWMIFQRRKSEQQKKENKIDAANPNMSKHKEMFLVAKNETEAKEIFDINSSESRRVIKERESFISENKSVNESELPDVKREISETIQSLSKNNKR